METQLETKQKDIIRLADGNPGAIRALVELLKPANGEAYDLFVQSLDELGYKGPDIWVAYKNFANQNPVKLGIALLTKDEAMQAVVARSRR